MLPSYNQSLLYLRLVNGLRRIRYHRLSKVLISIKLQLNIGGSKEKEKQLVKATLIQQLGFSTREL